MDQIYYVYIGSICNSYGVSGSCCIRGAQVLVIGQITNSAISSCCDKCTEKSICVNYMDTNSFNFFYGDEHESLLDLCLIHVQPQRNC